MISTSVSSMISTSLRIDERHQLPSAKLGLAGVHLKFTLGPVPAFPPVPPGRLKLGRAFPAPFEPGPLAVHQWPHAIQELEGHVAFESRESRANQPGQPSCTL